jgi:tetratricopeptide (TPR) repeat protein
MNTRPERLDKDGFPIPAGFDANDPIETQRTPRGPLVRRVLRWGVLAGLLAAVWFYFDLGTRARNLIGDYLCNEGIRQYQQNNLPGALESLDRAVDWAPKSGRAIAIRMQLHLELGNWEAALGDSHRVAELEEGSTIWVTGRLRALQGLRRHRETADFASEMLQRSLGSRISMLNARAYARAHGEFALAEALADIDEAIAAIKPNDVEDDDAPLSRRPSEQVVALHQTTAALVDTRGFVLLKLGRDKEALADFEKAIAHSDKALEAMGRKTNAERRQEFSRSRIERRLQEFDEERSVIIHHRGEAYQKLGQAEKAQKDFDEARSLGYDPEKTY